MLGVEFISQIEIISKNTCRRRYKTV